MTVVAQDIGLSLPEASVRVDAPVAGTVKSVARAFRALEYVATRRDGASAKEIAAHLDIALPSTYHLLATLVESGYLVHLANNARFGLGYQIRVLEQGLTHQLEVPKAIQDAIGHLHAEADAAAYYAVYRETEVVLAHVVDSDRRPRVRVLEVGFHEATHATAFGKVMLAAMTVQQRQEYIRRVGLRACTGKTITDPDALEQHLAHVRESGIALEIGEFQDRIACMAAPVRTPAGEVVASVAISFPKALFAKHRWDLERAVRHGALVANRALSAR
ncbi:IclR family transcriptional regulator [Solicola gregarius]|uniref:IclR family transcriptional regulator n=1 Tax=Solicola gregarius TaxID=2908642 RepID=A0AA46TK74_9ACTN|nr:IclR family transcriptional regulator [Solicola gregarius]UYM06409.1 IclR family transcriptional regulator [Solicola gregarius]